MVGHSLRDENGAVRAHKPHVTTDLRMGIAAATAQRPDPSSGADQGEIGLTVVVTPMAGEAFLRRCLGALVRQAQWHSMEVVVPLDATIGSIKALRADYPQVVFLDTGAISTEAPPGTKAAAHESLDRRTAAGLQAARGRVVALTHDYAIPDPGWCDQVLAAHQLPHAAIGGAVEHAGRDARNWALHLQDFGRYCLPLREGPARFLSDVNVSYKREALEAVKELWAERYGEVTVNWALARKGMVLWQRPQMIVRLDLGTLRLSDLLAERFEGGKLFGSMRVKELGPAKRLAYLVGGIGIPIVLMGRIMRHGLRAKRNRLPLLYCLPFVVPLVGAWCLGEYMAYWSAGASVGEGHRANKAPATR